MKIQIIILLLILLTGLLNANEKPDKVEMEYQGEQGFWISKWLADALVKSDDYLTLISDTLGIKDSNMESKLKYYVRADYSIRILTAVLATTMAILVGLIISVICSVCISYQFFIAARR